MLPRLWRALSDPAAWEAALAIVGAMTVVGLASLAIRPDWRQKLGQALWESALPGHVSRARVIQVIDGDTLVIEGGATVRLLGIDAPETSHPGLEHPQAYGQEAKERLRRLVEGRVVSLEQDVSDTDHYGRSLRHVWLGGRLVSEVLVAEGLARANSIPPDRRYADRLARAEERARRSGRGLWSLPRPTPIGVFRLLPPPAK